MVQISFLLRRYFLFQVLLALISVKELVWRLRTYVEPGSSMRIGLGVDGFVFGFESIAGVLVFLRRVVSTEPVGMRESHLDLV